MIVKKKSSGVRKQRARLSIRKGGQLGRRTLRTEQVRNRPQRPVTTRAIARSAWVFTGGVLRGCYGGVTGVMAAVVSGHYGSAVTTGRRSLRVGGNYGSAVTTGRRPLRVGGHYGSAVTTGRRPLRVSSHYGSAATTGQRSLRVGGHYGSAVTTEDSLLPSPIGYSLLPISRAVGVWYAPGRRGEQSVAGYGVVWISQRISRPSSSVYLTEQPVGAESSSVLFSMFSSPKIPPLICRVTLSFPSPERIGMI